MKEPKIRFVEKADISNLIKLCELHALFEKSEYNSTGKGAALEEHLFSHNPALYCLVAELDGVLVGYATYMKQFSTWDANNYIYMDCLFLTEDSRGFGTGEQLIERIKVEAKKLDCSLIQWQTPIFNTRAMKFYDRIGATDKTKARYFLNVG